MKKVMKMLIGVLAIAIVSCIFAGLALTLMVNLPHILGANIGILLTQLLVIITPAIIVVIDIGVAYVFEKKEILTSSQTKCMLLIANFLYALMVYGIGAMLSSSLDFGEGLALALEMILVLGGICICEFVLILFLIGNLKHRGDI